MSRYLRSGQQEYGLDIRNVLEIIGTLKVTEIPDMPIFVKGVINLRGKVIPVIDVRLRFNMPEREYDDRTSIIVVKVNDSSVGFIVDTVSEVLEIPADQIEPPPSIKKGESSRFVEGMGKVGSDVKILLCADKLLYEEVLQSIPEESPTNGVEADEQPATEAMPE